MFAGDEETVALGVVGDAVEDGLGVDLLVGRQEAGAVDPVDDVAVVGIDAGDAVGVPDVGVDDAIDVFELVELIDEGGAVVDDNVAGFGEVAGLRKRRVGVPSLVMSSVAVRVMPQPSPS